MAKLSLNKLDSNESVKFELLFTLFGRSRSQILKFNVPKFPKRMSNVKPKITSIPLIKEISGNTTNYGIVKYRIASPRGYPANRFLLFVTTNINLTTISKDDKVTFTTNAGDGLLPLNTIKGNVKQINRITKIVEIDVPKTGLSIGSDSSVNPSTNYFTDTDLRVQGQTYTVEIDDVAVINARNDTDTVKDILIFAYSQSNKKLQPGTTKYLMSSTSIPPESVSNSSPPSFSTADEQYSDESYPYVSRWINPKDGSFLYFFVAVARYTRYIKPDYSFSDWSGDWLQKNEDGTPIWTIPFNVGG
jgi:hypothetical protein